MRSYSACFIQPGLVVMVVMDANRPHVLFLVGADNKITTTTIKLILIYLTFRCPSHLNSLFFCDSLSPIFPFFA